MGTFEESWEQVVNRVSLYCRWIADNEDQADEIFQRTAIRVWKNYASFRYQSSFLTWVLVIARNEANRFYSQQTRYSSKEISLDENEFDIQDENFNCWADGAGFPNFSLFHLTEILKDAVHREVITSVEFQVVLFRIQQPNSTWDELSCLLNIPTATCAVHHYRSVIKLRVFLFTHYPQLLGGLETIQEAFDCTMSSLNQAEREAFKNIVLEKKRYKKAGWRKVLRSACSKVINNLPCDF